MALLIEGPPGSGKSAIAAQMDSANAGELAEPDLPTPGWLAYTHFCRNREPSTLSPLTFVERLSEALARRDEGFRRALLEARAITVAPVGVVQAGEIHPGASVSGVQISVNLHSYSPALAYEELVRKPLARASAGSDERVVLVDALDEGSELGSDSIAELLARIITDRAPGRLRFVLTARSADSRIDDRFPRAGRIHLVRDAPVGAPDIREYIAARLMELPAREREIATGRITDASDGIFLYAKHVVDALLADRRAWSNPERFALPRSLTEVYSNFLTRELARDRQHRDWQERFRPVLALLAVARGEGLTREVLVGASRQLSDARPAQLWDAITACQPFLQVNAEGRVRIFHESFREFLLAAPPYPIFVPEAQDALCDFLIDHHAADWQGQDDRYSVEHLPAHLLDATRVATLTALLKEPTFIEAKVSRFGVPAIMRDLAGAVHASSGTEAGDQMRELYDLIDRVAHRLPGAAESDRPGQISQHLLLAAQESGSEWIGELAERHLIGIGRPYLRTKWHAGSASPALRRTLVGHQAPVLFVTIDALGERALSASEDGTARLWDVETGESLRVFGPHPTALVTARFIRDESAVVTAAGDGSVRVWDIRTAAMTAEFDVSAKITAFEVGCDQASCLVGTSTGVVTTWSLNGEATRLSPTCDSPVGILRCNDHVIVAGTRGGDIHVWRADGRYHGPLQGHTDSISQLLIIDEMRAVSASSDGSVRFWDLDTLSCSRDMRSENRVQCLDLAWVPGSDVVVCAGNAWAIHVYDHETGDEVGTITSDKMLPNLMTMSPDGTMLLATSTEDRRIRVVDLSSMDVVDELSGHSNGVYGMCITADSRRVVTASYDRTVRVWDLTTTPNEGFAGHGASVLAVCAAPRHNLLLSSSFDDTLRGWDLETGEPRLFYSRVIQQFINVIHAGAADNGALVGNARGNIEFFPMGEGAQIHALNYSLRRVEWIFAKGLKSVSSLAVLKHQKLLVSASWHDTPIHVWDLSNGSLVHTMTGHTAPVRALAALPNDLVASAAEDGSIRVWDPGEGRLSYTMSMDDGVGIHELKASPDGHLLLAGCADGSLRLWDVANRRQIRNIDAHRLAVNAVAWWAPDRAYSVSDDGWVAEWDLAQGSRTLSVNMSSPINQIVAENGALYFGTAAGDMHCLVRAPVQQASVCQGTQIIDAREYPGHVNDLNTRLRLADQLSRSGDPSSAAETLKTLLPELERAVGQDDRRNLNARSQLVLWHGEAGDPVAALEAAGELVAYALRIFGPDDADTLRARGTQANLRGEAGSPDGAVTAFEQLLADRLRLLGPEHPDTLMTRNNLAYWSAKAGDPAGAVDAFEQLLVDRRRVLGPDHPHTLDTYLNLAHARLDAGDAAGAVDALKQLAHHQKRVHGPRDPRSLGTLLKLASWHAEADDPDSAAKVLEQLLPDLEQALGVDHVTTRAARTTLAQRRAEVAGSAGTPDAANNR
ncbi:tetratricopeptide repeat protein [Rugosimonospora africana]|uniref:tetratricopeptide repeat protein n=1 Tax=Rugosimonospora africana TaxID=556532 RepID=UPI0019414686|nr:tetratricopeptide repeat protein [Rugosimonospora africana]